MKMANESIEITIDPRIMNHDDERINALRSNKITPLEFWKLTSERDPWIPHGKQITYLPKEDNDKLKEKFIQDTIKWIKETGKLYPALVYNNRELFKIIYPELTESIIKAEGIITDPNCPSCTINKECKFLLDALFAIKYDGRDLSKLETVMTPANPRDPNYKPVPAIDKYGYSKLKQENFEIDISEIKFPPQLDKIYSPLIESAKLETINIESLALNYNLLRPSCLDCFKKHGCVSVVLLREILHGYTKAKGHMHQDMVETNLEQAIEESYKDYPELSKEVKSMLDEYKLTYDHSTLLGKLLNTLKTQYSGLNDEKIDIIGQLSELSDKLILTHPELSQTLRTCRIVIQEQKIDIRDQRVLTS